MCMHGILVWQGLRGYFRAFSPTDKGVQQHARKSPENVNFVAVTVNEVLGVHLLHTKKKNKINGIYEILQRQ